MTLFSDIISQNNLNIRKHMFFIHGLLGAGRNFRYIASHENVNLI